MIAEISDVSVLVAKLLMEILWNNIGHFTTFLGTMNNIKTIPIPIFWILTKSTVFKFQNDYGMDIKSVR